MSKAKITFYCATETMGDNVTESDADGYRNWANEQLTAEYPDCDIEVKDQNSLHSISISDYDYNDQEFNDLKLKEEAESFVKHLWDNCKWGWVA